MLGLGKYRQGTRRRRERIGFVLSGGGVFGAIQVGQIRALMEAGIVPDVIAGTSVGALNATAIAADPTQASVDRLEDIWVNLRAEDLFPGSAIQRALHFVRKGDHLYPNNGVRRLIDRIGARSFESLQLPLAVVAANLRTGAETCFRSGSLAPALLASTALPGVFPPVLVDGELYVDGGVVNNIPISQAVALGATKIYVLTCGTTRPASTPIKRPLDVLVQAFGHSRAARGELDLERYAQLVRLEVLPKIENEYQRYNDTSNGAELVRLGYESTAAYLAAPVAAMP